MEIVICRQRVDDLEANVKSRLNFEKSKISEDFLLKERLIGQQFRRAREDLETKLKSQQADIKEKYGDVIVATKDIKRRKLLHWPSIGKSGYHITMAIKNI